MGRMHLFGVEKVVFAPSVASLAAPTRLEITAGVVLVDPGVYAHEGLQEMSGFEAASTFIDVPDASTDFDGKIPGRKQAGEPTLNFYESDSGSPVRTALAQDTEGYVIRMPYGDVAGKRCEVYPVTVASVNTSQLTSGNDAATFAAAMAVTAKPDKEAVIPAL
jgi:hypothetical protein